MKRKRLVTLLGCIVLALLLLGLSFTTAFAQQTVARAPAKRYVFKAVSIFPSTHAAYHAFAALIDGINERAKGELIIKKIGGPEAIPGADQPAAVQRGVVDMASVHNPSYMGLVPGAMGLLASRLTLAEERDRGVLDFMRKLHAQAGLFFLGRPRDNDPAGLFYVWTQKQIQKPEDLAGKKVGAISPIHKPFAKALGAVPIVTPFPQLFGAVNRGMVEAAMVPIATFVTAGAHKAINYLVDHGFYTSAMCFLFNLDSWNSLPQHLQEIIEEVLRDVQKDELTLYQEKLNRDRKAAQDAGVQFIKLSPANAKRLIETAYSSYWDNFLRRNQKNGPKIRKLIEK